MRWVELTLAVLFFGLGVRSAVYWMRRPFEGDDPRDHALFALFVLGTVGMWWTIAAWFLIPLLLSDPVTGETLQGRAALDAIRESYWWMPLVFFGCAVLRFVARFFLGSRAPRPSRRDG